MPELYGRSIVPTSPPPGPQRRHVPAALALAAAAVMAFWLLTGLGGDRVVLVVDDVATFLGAALATVACGAAARRQVGRVSVFWQLLAAGTGAFTLAEGVWGWYELVLDQSVPVPSYADIGYLGAIPLVVAALLVYPSERRGSTRALAAVDAAALAISLLFLSWMFILQPISGAHPLTTADGLVSVAYPFGDAVILFLLVRTLWCLDGPERAPLAWIMLGLLAMSLSDSGYTYASLVKGYETGGVADVGWFVGYLGIALGGWHGARQHGLPSRARSQSTQTAALLTPYLPLFVALGVIGVRTSLGAQIDETSRALAYVLAALVMLRQLIRAVGGSPFVPTETHVELRGAEAS
ncbi:MAG: Signaling protein ykoW [Frankiales bacterium]|nr:Signaling protein ykoW [Frankiales bacterium]